MKMRKIIALLMAIVMLCGVLPFAALAEGETTATISFADKANRTEYSTDKQVWVQNGITVTNDKASSTSNVGDYSNPARFYKGSNLTIACAGMTTVVINCNSGKSNGPSDLQKSIVTEGATVAVDGMVVTVTLASAVDTVVFENLSGQVRVDEITVTTAAAETPAEPKEATIDFSTTDQRVSQDDNSQIWANEGLTVTNGIGASTQPIKDYFNPVRIYANTSLKIEFAGMTKLVINCSESKYVNPMVNTLASLEGITTTSSGNAVTVEFAAATDVLDIEKMAAQVRIKSITAYSGTTGGETPDPEQPSKPTTPEEIVNAAYELGEGQALEGTYTLTGVITKVNTPFSDQYKNVTVTIVVNGMTDKPIQCYRLKGEGADMIGEGDTITVTGTLKNYYGTVEFDAGCNLDSYKLVPKTPEEIVNAAYGLAEGAALEGTFTLTGVITAVNTPYSEQYKNVTVTIVVGDMTDKPIQCYRLKGEGADLIAVGDTITVTGTLKNYYGTVEFDAGCNLDSYTKAGEEGGEDVEPPVVPEYAVVDTPVAGTAYKFGMVQGNLDGRIFYLAGGMSSYYMSTTEDVTAAIDVYLEETEGGYYLYTMDGENKLYINMVVSGVHVNAKYEAAASTVYTYDANAKTVIAEIEGAPYWHGTRNDNTYTTVGPCKTEFNGFYCQFYAEVVEEEPENPGTGSDVPETGDFALIAIGSLMVMSCAAVVLLKKKEF